VTPNIEWKDRRQWARKEIVGSVGYMDTSQGRVVVGSVKKGRSFWEVRIRNISGGMATATRLAGDLPKGKVMAGEIISRMLSQLSQTTARPQG